MLVRLRAICFLFFFNDTATPAIYTLSLHDALPIFYRAGSEIQGVDSEGKPLNNGLDYMQNAGDLKRLEVRLFGLDALNPRSEEHTSELQSHSDLVCRLLLEKKKKKN